jgi:TonB family protein
MGRVLIAAILALSALTVYSTAGAADYGPDLEGRAVRRVQPGYPALAKRHGIEGKVVVRVEVAADGTVTRATFIEGHALFKSASVAAAKLWVFGPTSGSTNGHVVFMFTRPAD